jgi:Ca2+-binding RTX toxin-like protein
VIRSVRAALGGGLVVAIVGIAAANTHAGVARCDGRSATIVGTDGNDTLDGTAGPDVIAGLSGNDTIQGVGAGDAICGDGGDDVLVGGGGADRIGGGDGFDIVIGEAGDDNLDGGAGEDIVAFIGAPSAEIVSLESGLAVGGDGSDSLSGFEDIWGTHYDDVLRGDDSNNGFVGYGGDDDMSGGGGDNDGVSYDATGGVVANLTGGTARHYPDPAQTISPGFDHLQGIESLIGSPEEDVLTGNDVRNGLDGEGGNDQIFGRGGDDVITAGPGDDSISGGSGDYDWITYDSSSKATDVDLSRGVATLAGHERDRLDGVEVVFGSRFDDSLIGDEADNLLVGLGGDDRIDGRAGSDTVGYTYGSGPKGGFTRRTGPVRVDLAAHTARDRGDPRQARGDSITHTENVLGSVRGDTIAGDGRPNLLVGDRGPDTLRGDDDDDALDGSEGSDRIFGGSGDGDFAYYMFGSKVTADLKRGTAREGRDLDRLASIEILAGSAHSDVLRGSPRADFLIGQEGADRVGGREGDDVLTGETLFGRDDSIDHLDGGAGHDSCLAPERRRCESKGLPPELRAEVRQARIQARLAPRLKKGAHRRNF